VTVAMILMISAVMRLVMVEAVVMMGATAKVKLLAVSPPASGCQGYALGETPPADSSRSS